MPLTIFSEDSNVGNVVIAKVTASFASMGFDETNIEYIMQVGEGGLMSWQPLRTVNAITGATEGKGYYFRTKIDLDISDYFETDGGTGSSLSIVTKEVISASGNTTYNVLTGINAFKIRWISPAGETLVRIGTTNGGEEIMIAEALGGNVPKWVTKDIEGPVTLYFNGITGVSNITIFKITV